MSRFTYEVPDGLVLGWLPEGDKWVPLHEEGGTPMPLQMELELYCKSYGTPEHIPFNPGRPDLYDPGSGPEFELEEVVIYLGDIKLCMSDKQATAFFGSKLMDKLWEDACDAATESGEFG